MIDYGKGYSCSWSLMKVDTATWAACDEMRGLLSASVERDADSDLLESGSARFDSRVSEDEFYGRLYILMEQSGEVERHPVATFLFSPGPTKDNMGFTDVEYTGRSVLSPAEDKVMLTGSYAPMGTDAAAYAASLIAACTPAPVSVEGSFVLTQNYVFAQGTTYMEAARTLLECAGWRIRVDGNGAITVMPKPVETKLSLDWAHASLLAPEVTGDGKLEDRHNRYVAVDGDHRAIVVYDEPDDPASFSRRGRYVDIYDESPQLCDGESLEEYARRKLYEDVSTMGSKSYVREWWPDTTVNDLVVGSISSVGLDSDMRVSKQSISTEHGALVSETSEVLR